MFDKILSWFINIWIGLIILLNVVNIISLFYFRGFMDGWSKMCEIYNPYNFTNVIFTLVTLAPAFLAIYIKERRKKKATNKA